MSDLNERMGIVESMGDLNMATEAAILDLSMAPFSIITRLLECMSLRDRFTCALVCKAWAEAATAATTSIVLRNRVEDISYLQAWLNKHGNQLKVLQLYGAHAALAALPCPHLQDLLLHNFVRNNVGSRVWTDIAAATKLTSVSLSYFFTQSRQADVVSALTALPDLQQLTWHVPHGGPRLSDNSLLQQTTQLTYLELRGVPSPALQHLSSLNKLQHLNISPDFNWVAAGCPGLQELKALTGLQLYNADDIPASTSQLTALQQLEVLTASLAAATRLQVLATLTQLKVQRLRGLSAQSVQLQLTSLQHLELGAYKSHDPMPMSFVASCKELRVLSLRKFALTGSGRGSLVASTMLHHLDLDGCIITAADEAAGPVSWQQVFPGPGRLPHLTSLQLSGVGPSLQQSDVECMVATCCNSLQVLQLSNLLDSFAPVLAGLPALTSLHLDNVTNRQCGALAQLTGLRELRMTRVNLSTTGLRQLAALQQLTSLGFSQGCLFVGVTPCMADVLLWELMLDKLPGCSYATVNKVCVAYT